MLCVRPLVSRNVENRGIMTCDYVETLSLIGLKVTVRPSMNSRKFLLASEFIGAVIETVKGEGQFDTIYIHRA